MAGLAENKANSANPAELELGLSWAELGNEKIEMTVSKDFSLASSWCTPFFL